ncbi:hypothetical protein ACXIUT_05320 [Achromobacter denitrificans]
MLSKSLESPSIAELLFSHGKLLIVAIAVGAIVGISLMPTRPPMWTSSGLIRIAQVTGPAPLVDAGTVIAMVQQASFVSKSLENAGLPPDLYADPKAQLARKTLVAIAQRNSSLIQLQIGGYSPEETKRVVEGAVAIAQRSPNVVQLQVSAYSPEEAKRIIEGALATLQQLTEESFHAEVSELKRKLKDTEALLATNAAERGSVIDALKSKQLSPTTQLPESLVISHLLRANEIESDRLRGLIHTVQAQLNPLRTFNTKLMAPISVSPVPQSNSTIVSAAIGALVGFIIAFAFALIQTTVRVRRSSHKHSNHD